MPRMTRRSMRLLLLGALWLASGSGCSPEALVGEGELPPGAENPEDMETREGALKAYRSGLIAGRRAIAGFSGSMVMVSGLMGDEMITRTTFFPWEVLPDRRILPQFSDPRAEEQQVNSFGNYVEAYRLLQEARSKAQIGGYLLRNFAPDDSPALAAHLQATEGYIDLYLADLYCSGIPLSTVESDGWTLAAGSSTQQVYERALSLLDSARTAASDSVRIVHFASIGIGRVMLALGRYADAAAAVSGVPDGFEYQLQFDANITGENGDQTREAANFIWILHQDGFGSGPGMADGEGVNGIPWISSGDPRTDAAIAGTDFSGVPYYLPTRLNLNGASPIAIADWREARLIEAEAALQAGDVATWLAKVNALREGQVFPPAADDPTQTPRTLPPLADPGTFDSRVDLLFRERAFWFHLTGRRYGDLRRLVREYGRDPSSVYPIGVHPTGGAYGSDVNAPVPAAELRYNSEYTGCLDRGA